MLKMVGCLPPYPAGAYYIDYSLAIGSQLLGKQVSFMFDPIQDRGVVHSADPGIAGQAWLLQQPISSAPVQRGGE